MITAAPSQIPGTWPKMTYPTSEAHNQRFELKSIDTRIADDGRAISKTEGVWYAAHWQSPAANSHDLIADLKHT